MIKGAFSHIHSGYAGARLDELEINESLRIPMTEIEMTAVRAQGAGGQNVNKVATAVHLRFDIANSPSITDTLRKKLLGSGDQRITADGVLIIKSQESRSQERNKQAALRRLVDLLAKASRKQKKRIPTKPGRKAKAKRLDAKSRHGNLKKSRQKVQDD